MLHQNGTKCISSSYFKSHYNAHDKNDIICTTYVVHAICYMYFLNPIVECHCKSMVHTREYTLALE